MKHFSLTVILSALWLATAAASEPVLVGRTGVLKDVLIPGGELAAKPDVSGRAPLALRITGVYPHGTAGFRYDFSYSAFAPGKYNLVEYLQPKQGAAGTAPPPVEVEIIAELPAGPPQTLPGLPDPAPQLGGYSILLKTGIALWVAGLLAILFWKRRKQADGDAAQVPTLSLADQLRPYVQQAQEGTLDAGGRAAMERLVLGFWRERLGLTGQPVAQAITTLRAHPEAGALLRKVEHWLHAPPATGQADASADTAALLAPYLKS